MTAIDDFLVQSRQRVQYAVDSSRQSPLPTAHERAMLRVLEEVHSVLTVIAQNMPCNVDANSVKS